MRLNKKIIFYTFVSLYFISLISITYAHDHPIYFPEGGRDVLEGDPLWVKIMYYSWSFHDHIHWIFVVLMLFTCYHFRFSPGKTLFGHPRKCFALDKSYTGEINIHKYHRLFWWANLILITIHWTEIVTGWQYGLDYTYTFSNQQVGIIIESLYVITFTLWLLSCHFFRYFLSGKDSHYSKCASCTLKGNIYHFNSKFNKLHGVFMWLTIISMIALIILQGHL